MIRRTPERRQGASREIWLYRNTAALKKVREGLAQAAERKLRSLGSFAKYADKEME